MKKYVLKECSCSCYWKDRAQLQEGFAVYNDEDPREIAVFDDEQQAMQELHKYETSVIYYEGMPYNFYAVTEYCIEIGEYDEEGEFVGGSVDYRIADFPQYENIKFYN